MSSIHVVSYNMRKGKGVRGSRPRLEELVDSLGHLDSDLLLCQEVFHEHAGVDQTGEMAQALRLSPRYEPNATYRRGHHGNATLSRLDILAHENRDISPNRIERRGILYTRLGLWEGGHIHVFNTHFALTQRQRIRQARELGAMLERLTQSTDPVIIGGDFNDWTGRVDPLIREEGDLRNAMASLPTKERRTWSTRRPLWALDRLYYRNLDLIQVRVLRRSPWDRLSDHFPGQAEFRSSAD